MERNLELGRNIQQLREGQQRLNRAFAELELREAIAAADASEARRQRRATSSPGLEMLRIPARDVSEQSSLASGTSETATPGMQANPALEVARRNAALGAGPVAGPEPQPEPP
jgi:hypothetical protein